MDHTPCPLHLRRRPCLCYKAQTLDNIWGNSRLLWQSCEKIYTVHKYKTRNIQGSARNVIPLIVHTIHFYYYKNMTSGTELILIGWKIVPNEEHVQCDHRFVSQPLANESLHSLQLFDTSLQKVRGTTSLCGPWAACSYWRTCSMWPPFCLWRPEKARKCSADT